MSHDPCDIPGLHDGKVRWLGRTSALKAFSYTEELQQSDAVLYAKVGPCGPEQNLECCFVSSLWSSRLFNVSGGMHVLYQTWFEALCSALLVYMNFCLVLTELCRTSDFNILKLEQPFADDGFTTYHVGAASCASSMLELGLRKWSCRRLCCSLPKIHVLPLSFREQQQEECRAITMPMSA